MAITSPRSARRMHNRRVSLAESVGAMRDAIAYYVEKGNVEALDLALDFALYAGYSAARIRRECYRYGTPKWEACNRTVVAYSKAIGL